MPNFVTNASLQISHQFSKIKYVKSNKLLTNKRDASCIKCFKRFMQKHSFLSVGILSSYLIGYIKKGFNEHETPDL